MRFFSYAILFAVMTISSGCRAVVLQSDQDRFRQVLLDSYTEQLIDNLIRAANAMPIVQMDYTTITGTVSDTGSGSLSSTQTTADSTALTFGSTLKNLMSRTVSRGFTNAVGLFSASAMRNQQLSVTGNPVMDKPDVYRRYLEFLEKPGSLIRDCNPPPPGVAHIVRKRGDVYFYVPVNYRKDFFDLALKTTVMRTEPTFAPTSYPVKIVAATEISPTPKQASIDHYLTITVDPAIPNDNGTLKVTVGGTLHAVRLSKLPGNPDPANTFKVSYEESPNGFQLPSADVISGLKAATDAQVTLLNHQPDVPKTEAILQNIFNQVQLNRLDNLRLINSVNSH